MQVDRSHSNTYSATAWTADQELLLQGLLAALAVVESAGCNNISGCSYRRNNRSYDVCPITAARTVLKELNCLPQRSGTELLLLVWVGIQWLML